MIIFLLLPSVIPSVGGQCGSVVHGVDFACTSATVSCDEYYINIFTSFGRAHDQTNLLFPLLLLLDH